MSGVQIIKVTGTPDWRYLQGVRGIHPRIISGVKILLDSDFEPLSDMNEFTVKLAATNLRAGRSWLNTQNAYSDDLYQYKVFLNAVCLEEQNVTLEDIQDYASCFVTGISVRTGRKFSAATVSRRLGTVVRYHRFRIYKGLESAVSAEGLATRGRWRDGKVLSDPDSPYRSVPRDAAAADKIRPFIDESWKLVLENLGPAASEGPNCSRRNRLACELALLTGLRIDEVCSLTVLQIRNLSRHVDKHRPAKLIPLRVTKTKGLKPGDVFLPSFLVEELLKYIEGERQEAVDKALRVKRDYRRTQSLFVNGILSNDKAIGNPLSTDTLSRAFTGACKQAGLTHVVQRHILDVDGSPLLSSAGAYLVEAVIVSDHTFHDLRHTFAMMTYRDLAEAGREEPWKLVSVRLRHSSILTTLRSYLTWLDRAEQRLSDAMLETFRAIDNLKEAA